VEQDEQKRKARTSDSESTNRTSKTGTAAKTRQPNEQLDRANHRRSASDAAVSDAVCRVQIVTDCFIAARFRMLLEYPFLPFLSNPS